MLGARKNMIPHLKAKVEDKESDSQACQWHVCKYIYIYIYVNNLVAQN